MLVYYDRSTMSEFQLQSCTMCSYCTTNPRQLLNHVFTIHRHDPNFHIYCSYCMRSYKKLSAYRKHISRGCTVPLAEDTTTEQRFLHQPIPPELPEEDALLPVTDDPGVENRDSWVTIPQQWHEARFILSIKEQHVMSQAAIDHVISSTTTLVSTLLNNITADIHTSDPQEILKIIDQRVCDAKATMFSGLSTSYQQQKYLVDNFHLVVRHKHGNMHNVL